MADLGSSYFSYFYLVFTYAKLWVEDKIEYYYTFLILSLPSYLFGPPVITIKQENYVDSSDSGSDEDNLIEYDVFISQLVLVFYDKKSVATYRTLNGAQLKPIVDHKGRFFVNSISQFYPTLDTIIIQYAKFEKKETDTKNENATTLTKVIDVAKRYDVRNHASCKMGVIF